MAPVLMPRKRYVLNLHEEILREVVFEYPKRIRKDRKKPSAGELGKLALTRLAHKLLNKKKKDHDKD